MSGNDSTMPKRWRSAGHEADARSSCSRAGQAPVMSCPSSVTRAAESALRRPTIASTSSSWPLPATPAMPRISPARTSKLDAVDDLVAAIVVDVQVLDARTGSPGWLSPRSTVSCDLAADHQLRQVVLVRLGGSRCRRPCRAG